MFYFASPKTTQSTPPAGSFDRKADEIRGVLGQLKAQGFETSHGEAMCDAIKLVGPSEPMRKLAGLVRLSKMVFLRVQAVLVGGQMSLTIDARMVWQTGSLARPAITPVTVAEVQVLHTLNGHEVAIDDTNPTWTQGQAVVLVSSPVLLYWDFLLQTYMVSSGAQLANLPPLEVHVHDAATGAHAVATT